MLETPNEYHFWGFERESIFGVLRDILFEWKRSKY